MNNYINKQINELISLFQIAIQETANLKDNTAQKWRNP